MFALSAHPVKGSRSRGETRRVDYWCWTSVGLVWDWCGASVGLVWYWCGIGVVLYWYSVVMVWYWCSTDVVLVWYWCGTGVVLYWYSLVMVWYWCSNGEIEPSVRKPPQIHAGSRRDQVVLGRCHIGHS